MYIDVLEHIENDQIDLQQAINYLKKVDFLCIVPRISYFILSL